jgi:hypothetical protein
MKRTFLILLSVLVLILLAVTGCGGGEEPTPIVIVVTAPASDAEPTSEVVEPPATDGTEIVEPPAADGIEILEATFAHGLGEEMQPIDPGTEFSPSETVNLSLKIKGRPKEGVVTARFFWHDSPITEASVDLADANSGLLFSFGEDTYVGYSLTPDQPFPVSNQYSALVLFNDEAVDVYAFSVVPPPDAIASTVNSVTLARGATENYDPIAPTTQFTSTAEVFLVGEGDLGTATWLQADLYINGEPYEEGTRSLTLEQNIPGAGFVFSFLPEGGWPEGEHFVVLTMNDWEVGRYTFTTSGEPVPGATGPFDEQVFWNEFPAPDDAEGTPVPDDYDGGFLTSMSEPEIFEAYAEWLTEQGWQQQAPIEATEAVPHQIWRTGGAELLIEIPGVDGDGRTIVWIRLTTDS